MNRSVKIAAVVLAMSVCVGGAILSARQNLDEQRIKTRVMPINNRQMHGNGWLRA